MMPFPARILALIACVGIALTLWRQRDSKIVSQKDITQLKDGQDAFAFNDAASVRRRVVAVADLHGDLEHAHNVLRMASLIDREANWIGGHDVFVSTGDIVDRGDDTISLYEMFQRLRTQARQAGGDVLNCIGNHEMMNALMDWRYVTPGDLKSFGGAIQRRHAMSDQGWIGQEWLANYSIAQTIALLPHEKIPEAIAQTYSVPHANFVHGGIHPAWASKGLSFINDIGHDLLLKALSNQQPNGRMPSDTTTTEKVFYGEEGPLWYRGYALDEEQDVCQEAEQATTSLNVRHLVMGHTPHLSGFVVRCHDASVLLIDTGISRAYGGEQSALIFDTLVRPAGAKSGGEWEEESTITALYRGRMPKVIDSRVRRIT